jgi:hypothetical protein
MKILCQITYLYLLIARNNKVFVLFFEIALNYLSEVGSIMTGIGEYVVNLTDPPSCLETD